MPFVPVTPNREAIDKDGLNACKSVGDVCYFYYRQMMDEWNREPRWTTAHIIYRRLGDIQPTLAETSCLWLNGKLSKDDYMVAESLAWQVFFNLHVMNYEHKKRAENGDIA